MNCTRMIKPHPDGFHFPTTCIISQSNSTRSGGVFGRSSSVPFPLCACLLHGPERHPETRKHASPGRPSNLQMAIPLVQRSRRGGAGLGWQRLRASQIWGKQIQSGCVLLMIPQGLEGWICGIEP